MEGSLPPSLLKRKRAQPVIYKGVVLMDKESFNVLHAAADRLALEATRRLPREGVGNDEAECYIEQYQKVLRFLVDQQKKYFTP